jgi:hypothetical protein
MLGFSIFDRGLAGKLWASRGWTAAALALVGATAAAILASCSFAAGLPARDMPILPFALALAAAGALFLLLVPLIRRTEELRPCAARRLLLPIFVVGVALRLMLLASEPVLEVDFYRYLWDGALTANGHNPFATAPARVRDLGYDDPRLELSKAAGDVFERISYPELKTVYPPVAQAAFALAYLIEPWSLTAWRIVALAGDMATFLLLVALLRAAGRSPLWSALYWWCPLVLKEIANSAHMEAVLLPFVLGSLLLTVRRRPLAATVVLGLAIGTKLWPVMLVPLVLRPLAGRPQMLAAALALLVAMLALCAWPVWRGGLDATSGFVGFANHWATNSAHFPALERLVALAVAGEPQSLLPGRIVRLLSAAIVLGTALWLARRPIADAIDLLQRAFVVVSVLVLLSPAQFPWYVLWVLPLAVIRPGLGWHVAAALMPIYYTAFHFIARGSYATYGTMVIWLLWVPIWLALAADVWRRRRQGVGSGSAPGLG